MDWVISFKTDNENKTINFQSKGDIMKHDSKCINGRDFRSHGVPEEREIATQKI